MAIRKDKVQISIAFLTDESKQYAKLIEENKKFISDINKARKSGGDLTKVINGIVESGKKVSGINLNKLASSQLVTRAKQLSAAMKLIPASTPQFKQLEKELKDINNVLAEQRQRTKGVSAAMDGARKSGSRFGGVMRNAFSFFIGQGLFSAATGLFRGLANFTKDAVAGIDEGIKRDAQIKQQLINTNSAAGKSFEDLAAQAKQLTKETLFTDEQIKNAQAITLTFTNIRDEVFDRTIPVIQDLSTVMGTDLTSGSIQLGKALNDPIAGITALSRTGIQFNDSQKSMIKGFVETNDIASAQNIILEELEKQVGGTAKAAAEAGLGPYQLLQQRLVDVQESVGVLIERGLKFLLPILKRGTEFLESLTDSLVSGEEATGKYAAGVNTTIKVVSGLVNWWQFLFRVGQALYNNVFQPIGSFLANTLSKAFSAAGGEASIFSDIISNGGAAFEGLSAAAAQAVENVKAKFSILVNSAKIFGKQLRSAITFSDETKAQLAQEISDLKSNNKLAAESGKSVGDAYRDARDKAIAESAASAASTPTAAGAAQVPGLAPPDQDFSIGGPSGNSIKKNLENKKKAIEQAAIEQEAILELARLNGEVTEVQAQERLLAIRKESLTAQAKLYQVFKQGETVEASKINLELVKLEKDGNAAIIAAQIEGRDKVTATLTEAARTQFLTQQITEDEFRQQSLQLFIEGENAKLQVLENAGQQKTLKYTEIQNGILKAQNDQQQLRTDSLQEGLDNDLNLIAFGLEKREALLRSKFLEGVINQQELEAETDAARLATVDAEILALQNSDVAEVEALRKKELEKLGIEQDIAQKRIDSEMRVAEAKKKILAAGFDAAEGFFKLGVELLGKDEAAKKKNAAAIKAFQIGEVIVRGIKEVQTIWANAAQLGPIAGPIVGGVQTALAVGRSASAIGKIKSTKLARGGAMQFGVFGGRSHSQGGTKGYFDDGTEIEVEAGELFAVVNKKDTATLGTLSRINSRNGRPFFSEGGTLDTTPSIPGPAGNSGQQKAEMDFQLMVGLLQRLNNGFDRFPTRLRADVVYNDITDAGDTLNTIERESNL